MSMRSIRLNVQRVYGLYRSHVVMSNKDKDALTSIRVRKSTAARIAALGIKGSSYDMILVQMLDALPKRFHVQHSSNEET